MWSGILRMVAGWLTLSRDVEELRLRVREFQDVQNEMLLDLRDLKADLRRGEQESRHRDELLAARLEQLADKIETSRPALPTSRRRKR
jgi:DNA anti-recombination protein RmuC